MAKGIKMITEYVNGKHPGLFGTDYYVYYESGRKVHYNANDNLPMPVVNFLTNENTVCETVYFPDDYRKCIDKRITYKSAN